MEVNCYNINTHRAEHELLFKCLYKVQHFRERRYTPSRHSVWAHFEPQVSIMSCCPQYRAWLRSSFRPSPFNDQEQVGALLSQYTEQQESQRRGADHRWINQSVSALPSNPNDPEGSSWNLGLWPWPASCVNGSSYILDSLVTPTPSCIQLYCLWAHIRMKCPLKSYVLYFHLHPSSHVSDFATISTNTNAHAPPNWVKPLHGYQCSLTPYFKHLSTLAMMNKPHFHVDSSHLQCSTQ